MLLGALVRAELALEGVAERLPLGQYLVDRYCAFRMQSAWRREAQRTARGRLVDHERQEFSQNGEDGIIEWIFERIGVSNQWLVEIGASDGEENCTRSLVEQGWTGLWVEADPARAAHAAEVSQGRVKVVDTAARPETVGDLLSSVRAPDRPDLVVIDIDGNDWWVLKALLSRNSPRVLVVEYNACFPPGRWWVQPYKQAAWDRSFRVGASLDALAALARTHGLCLVGCDSAGVNAFFVATDDAMKLSSTSLGSVEDLYCAPWFGQRLWGHPRRPDPSTTVAKTERLASHELMAVRLRARTWPNPKIRRVVVEQPVVLAASVSNGTGRLLTGTGDETPLHIATRWRRQNQPRGEWDQEPRGDVPEVRPGRTVATRLWRRAPAVPGPYYLDVALVQENVAWLDHDQVAIALEVVPADSA
jgi:hypothetical protein